MNARLMLNEHHILPENAFVETVVWLLDSPLSGGGHGFKYRLALVVDGICVLRYDNEPGKGDHKHGENRVLFGSNKDQRKLLMRQELFRHAELIFTAKAQSTQSAGGGLFYVCR